MSDLNNLDENKNTDLSDNNDVTIYPENKDWVNYTVNRHDGWADDVSLVYKDENWKPDEEELTLVTLDNENEDQDEPETDSSVTRLKKKTLSRFSVFLILWSILLISVIIISLISYHDRLTRFEEAYYNSLPDAYMNQYMVYFEENDIDSIYGLLTVLPGLTPFETDMAVKTYIAKDIIDSDISFKEKSVNNDEYSYTIMAGSRPVADLVLKDLTSKQDEFGFCDKFITSFEYEFNPSYKVDITIPSDSSLYINSILVPEEYISDSNTSQSHYIINGLFAEPAITVLDRNEKQYDVYYDIDNDIYVIK